MTVQVKQQAIQIAEELDASVAQCLELVVQVRDQAIEIECLQRERDTWRDLALTLRLEVSKLRELALLQDEQLEHNYSCLASLLDTVGELQAAVTGRAYTAMTRH